MIQQIKINIGNLKLKKKYEKHIHFFILPTHADMKKIGFLDTGWFYSDIFKL